MLKTKLTQTWPPTNTMRIHGNNDQQGIATEIQCGSIPKMLRQVATTRTYTVDLRHYQDIATTSYTVDLCDHTITPSQPGY